MRSSCDSCLVYAHLDNTASFNGWRLTMVDSLDTMLLMGLFDEFHQAIPILANMTFALNEVSIT